VATLLPALRAAVGVVAFESEFGRELGEAADGIHFLAPVLAAALVGGFEGAVVSGAVEGEEFVPAVSEAPEEAVSAVDHAV